MSRIRLTYLVATVLCLALVAVGFLIGAKPQLDIAAAAERERASIAMQNAALELRLADLARARDELDAHKTTLAELRRAMPTDGDYEAYLDELALLAQEAGVALTSASFSDAVPYGGDAAAAESGAAPVPAEPDAAAPADPDAAPAPSDAAPDDAAAPAPPASGPVPGTLYAIPVQVGVAGPGPAVQAFLDSVQRASRFTLVTRASLTAEGDAGDVAAGEANAVLDGFVWALPE
jgi:hypothetical protein